MANTIKIKRSSTATAVPTAGQLAEGELAINVTDQILYSKDATTVFRVGVYDDVAEDITGAWDFQNTLRISNSAAPTTDYVDFTHDGTYFNISGAATDAIRVLEPTWILGGNEFRIYDSGNTDSAKFSHDGTDFNTVFVNTTEWNVEDVSGVTIDRQANGTTRLAIGPYDGTLRGDSQDGALDLYGEHSGVVYGARLYTGSSNVFIDGISANPVTGFMANLDVSILAGNYLRIQDSGNTDYAQFSHDGTDFNTAFTNTTDWNITGLAGGNVVYENNVGLKFLKNDTSDDSTRLYRATGDSLRMEYAGNNLILRALGDQSLSFRNSADTDAARITFNAPHGSGYGLQVRAGNHFRVYDSTNTDYAEFSHDGVDVNTSFTNTTDWNITGADYVKLDANTAGGLVASEGTTWKMILDHSADHLWLRDGYVFRISNASDTDYAEFSHDGTDFNTSFTNTTDWNVSGISALQVAADVNPTGNITGTKHSSLIHNFVADLSYEGTAFYNPETFNAYAGLDLWNAGVTLTNVMESDRTTAQTALGTGPFRCPASSWTVYFNIAVDEMVIEIDHTAEPLRWSALVGIQWSAPGWRAKRVKIEAYNGTSWSTGLDTTTNDSTTAMCTFALSSAGVQKVRFTLGDPQNTSNYYMRISKIFGYDYTGVSSRDAVKSGTYYLDKWSDSAHYANIYPAVDSTTDLGTTSLRYANVYTDAITVTNTINADYFEATGLGPTTTAGTDDAYFGGYGIIGDRATAFYVSNASGPVKLNYAGTHGTGVKLETTTDGVTVTGALVATGNTQLGSDTAAVLNLERSSSNYILAQKSGTAELWIGSGTEIHFCSGQADGDFQANKRFSIETNGRVRFWDAAATPTDYGEFWHDGTDFNTAFTNTTDWNITGITAIQAGTVDADFDAITATSYGGITEANLVDKTAAETISNAWTFTSDPTIETAWPIFRLNETGVAANSGNWRVEANATQFIISTDVDAETGGTAAMTISRSTSTPSSIAFSTPITATSYGGITEANLVDKTATESITGTWTFDGGAGTAQLYVSGTQGNLNLQDNNATADEGNWIVRSSAGVFTIATATDAAPTSTVDSAFQIARSSGTTVNYVRSNADTQVRGGKYLRVYDSGNTDYCNLSHDGTDMIYGHTNTGQAKFNGISVLKSAGSLMISESAADQASEATYGQFWVKNDAPNTPWFTDDGNNEYPIGTAAYRMYANQSDTVDGLYVNGAWYSDNATAYTLTLEASSTTAFPVGGQFTIWNEGSGTLTINEGTGDTLYLMDGSSVTDTAGGCTMAQGGYATVIRKSATVWLIMGAGLTA